MAGDFNKPVVTDDYTSVLQSIKDLMADLVKGLDGTGTTNVPVNAIRWSSANNRFEKYNGSSWAALATTYAISISGSAATVRDGSVTTAKFAAGAKAPLSGTSDNSNALGGVALSALQWYQGWVNSPGYDANTLPGGRSGFSYANNAPRVGPLVHFDAGGYGLQLSADYAGNGVGFSFRTRNGDTNLWNSWWTIAHSGNAPGALNAQAAGTYGGMNITGAANGWAGFQFNSTSRYFMSSGGQTGEYDTSASAWQWRWDNGTLVAGTVPWDRLSGVPAMSYLPLSGGTLSGALTVNANEVVIQGSSPRVRLYDVESGNRYLYADGGLIGFLNTSGSWVFYENNSGQLWTSNYGWLHDYFTRTVNAGSGLTGGGSGSSLTLAHSNNGTAGTYGGSAGSLWITTDARGHVTSAGVSNCNCI